MCRLRYDDPTEQWTTVYRDQLILGENPASVRHQVKILKQAEMPREEVEISEEDEAAKHLRHWCDDPKHWAVEERDE